jgi:hypothetical protein
VLFSAHQKLLVQHFFIEAPSINKARFVHEKSIDPRGRR